MTVGELASRLAIDRTNVSRLCARMEGAGELTRRPLPSDGRAVILELSELGEQEAASVDQSSAAHFGRLVRLLGAQAASVIASLELLAEVMALHEEEK
jgi:DNA-binding MarR family transcriptional regulator